MSTLIQRHFLKEFVALKYIVNYKIQYFRVLYRNKRNFLILIIRNLRDTFWLANSDYRNFPFIVIYNKLNYRLSFN